ncbi:MAG: hypothetical protein QGH66_00685 [Dehalococcoidia bacterium]|jgi:hypothetical protein|nr:hypothetical protein [Dehalococcoidia bacterium]
MVKMKTFTTALKIFHPADELNKLDQEVSSFLTGAGIKSVISVSDTATTHNTGATMGLMRVVAYEA